MSWYNRFSGYLSLFLLGLMVIYLAACRQQEESWQPPVGQIVIGGKGGGYTENTILFKIISIYLKEHGYNVHEIPDIDTGSAHAALIDGQIDLYWEYTGTALSLFWGLPSQPDALTSYVKAKQLDEDNGLIWLDMAPASSSYVVLMNPDRAAALGVERLSQLAAVYKEGSYPMVFAASPDCLERYDCMVGLQHYYEIEVDPKDVRLMSARHFYRALSEDQVDAVIGVLSDIQIEQNNLFIVKDDKGFFHHYNSAPVLRKTYLDKNPELTSLINRVSARIDQRTIRSLVDAVDNQNMIVTDVVRKWLVSCGLISL